MKDSIKKYYNIIIAGAGRKSGSVIGDLAGLVIMFCLLLMCGVPSALAYNMRQTFSGDGLSNSAILSMSSDSKGYLWVGTCDGVNIADGKSIHTFQSLFPGQKLSGNIIEEIVNGENGIMWVLTNYSLDRVDLLSQKVISFPQFHGQELLNVAPDGRLFVLSEDSRLHVFEPSESEFKVLGAIDKKFSDVCCIYYRKDGLWVIGENGINVYGDDVLYAGASGSLRPDKSYNNIHTRFARSKGDKLLSISKTGKLCEINEDGTQHRILDISKELSERGNVSDIIKDRQGNYFVSFSTDGVIWIGKDSVNRYSVMDLGLEVGVFCLESSPVQDVVWIGSDCQGVYTFWDDRYSVRSYDFNDFNHKISHPVRSIYVDEYKNMWLGTKGDGLLKVAGLDEKNPAHSLGDGYLFTSSNSELCHNSVFDIEFSSRPLLWVATEKGMNYYSYADSRIHRLPTDGDVNYIHGVYEENDTTLWMCTLGMGVIRATISGSATAPVLKNLRRYVLDGGQLSSNQFFSITVGEDGKLLFCNRGKGLFRIEDEKLVSVPLKNEHNNNTVNDIFTAKERGDVLWIGTGFGLIKSWPGGEQHFYGVDCGFKNNTIHDIVLSSDGKVWLSTNDGIIRFDADKDNGVTYGRNYGLSVTEYSDGAGCNTGKSVIFGGINGVTFINPNWTYDISKVYAPAISILSLSISGENVPIVDYMDSKDGNKIVLASDQNYFTITISTPDFIDASNYIYSYSLDGVTWINNSSNSSISFNGMKYGTYNMEVKYVNSATGVESEPWKIKIVIKAPWYLSGIALAAYLLLFIGIVALLFRRYASRQRSIQKENLRQLEQMHKDEVYEEKLRFFTNITHEFCTPLTLIYGPCERILGYEGSDDYIKKYVGLIRSNAERLNNLIQELIDFRRMETGNKQLKVTSVGVSDLCSDIMTAFSELADRNNIDFISEIEPDIVWPTDFGCVRKIMTNLISNAFKYTPSGGIIKINVREEAGLLRMSVYNTGKGISEEEKLRIFNRYSVLDNVEENAVKGLSSRNGLGLAICHSMVDMLKGRIMIESEVGKYADFIVEIPKLDLTPVKAEPESNDKDSSAPAVKIETEDEHIKIEMPAGDDRKEEKSRILVVDDNSGILSLLRDSLSDYNVETADSADIALESIRKMPPDLIISDIMMPGTDGVSFTRMIKQNKHTMHIPLILLSAKNRNEEKIEGIESGADAYIGKPFSLHYLMAMVKRLLENRKNLREYYTTSASAFEYTDGQLMHKEDKDFIEQIARYIEENIEDEDLGPEKLAEHMKISVRNLYRRFKELDQLSPNDFIKYQRIGFAARLLLTTSATVQEIIYRSGFTNRSHFYKEFDKRFGMTPKGYRDANARKDTSLDGKGADTVDS